MNGPEPAATQEPAWHGPDRAAQHEPAPPDNRILSFIRRLVWVLISLLVILSLLAPLLAPIFQTRQSRPKTSPDGLQAHLPPPAPAYTLAARPF